MVCVEVYGLFFLKAMFCFIQVVGGNRQKDTKKKSLRSRKIGLEDKKGEGAQPTGSGIFNDNLQYHKRNFTCRLLF